MYPVRLDFAQVIGRIKALQKNGHDAEALVTSIFTLEKLIKRSLRRAIVARGFTIKQADKLLARNGFDALVEMWPIFEREHRTLQSLVGGVWAPIKKAKEMRNAFVHGTKVFDLGDCRAKANEVLVALDVLHTHVVTDYGVDPWHKQPERKAQLQWVV